MEKNPVKKVVRRSLLLDRVRGVAVLLMIVYHFSFDLDQYGWIHQSFNSDLRWLAFRAVIVSLFMAALGASTVLAWPDRVDWRRLRHRQLRLGAAALTVSAASALMFPASFIWFGILHFAWVASLAALPLRGRGWPLLVLAALVAWAGNSLAAAFFDTPWLGWIGFMTAKPYTEDYVPLFPWFAAVLVGLFVGERLQRAARQPLRVPTAAPAGRLDGALRLIGRHTLLLYLLHQPLLIGLLELLQRAGFRPAA
ncbi:MAG: DUF1624 domain-containing protein [Pseudomonadota bacterium]|nr:DUF1624 domain-containing protein [Pseudomonadota bacterium]